MRGLEGIGNPLPHAAGSDQIKVTGSPDQDLAAVTEGGRLKGGFPRSNTSPSAPTSRVTSYKLADPSPLQLGDREGDIECLLWGVLRVN